MNLLKKIFNHDSYLFGVVMALVSPVIFLYLMYYFIRFLSGIFNFRFYDIQEIILLGLVINVALIRYYLVNVKFLKTGHSIVALSFIEMFVFFLYFK